eukprot:CAMPEP_0202461624 /NCGR_PEP_ID=MMETSP1360-20130828/50173_1 /ASSEMBLY_ACC=CAM_ASM_000848 /TAXON_ID=515479 /ORGANISM="Licmophora paradoxa, Strain CCMP2313" /LENGTH=69 /DNA_ID=CAMNT_0049083743 /DNA_START=293 /DNA_END=502 /DNA_ORIENTATION=+
MTLVTSPGKSCANRMWDGGSVLSFFTGMEGGGGGGGGGAVPGGRGTVGGTANIAGGGASTAFFLLAFGT